MPYASIHWTMHLSWSDPQGQILPQKYPAHIVILPINYLNGYISLVAECTCFMVSAYFGSAWLSQSEQFTKELNFESCKNIHINTYTIMLHYFQVILNFHYQSTCSSSVILPHLYICLVNFWSTCILRIHISLPGPSL